MPGTAKGGTLDALKEAAEGLLRLAKAAADGCGLPGLEGTLGGIVAIIDAVKVRLAILHTQLLLANVRD